MKHISRVIIDDESDEVSSRTASPIRVKPEPRLFLEEEDKTNEAIQKFENLERNIYLYKSIGKCSEQQDTMTCDCREDWDSESNLACGPDSDCINRLTNIECVNGHCSCGSDCQNQRFQKREYSKISVFYTGAKGYGVRAESFIPADTFIYEYIGEIIDDKEFRTRRAQYDSEGIQHFYFMMLQSGEFIDATKKGSLARFCNHSCNPNGYVDKWVVGKRFKMGIFAKRDIIKGEEITFDYNVDRYGSNAQKCYCGEPNCIGFMGGKTQTESARLLPHALNEALGVKSSLEKQWLKEYKKLNKLPTPVDSSDNADELNNINNNNDLKKSKVNFEFVKFLNVKPMSPSAVSKVIGYLLQPDLDFIVISKLVGRISLTDDEDVLIRASRLHGIEAMSSALQSILSHAIANNNQLEDEAVETVNSILRILLNWPQLKARNTIQNCKIDQILEQLSKLINNEKSTRMIEKLTSYWNSLKVVYRIPKRGEITSASGSTNNNDQNSISLDERRNRDKARPIPYSQSNGNNNTNNIINKMSTYNGQNTFNFNGNGINNKSNIYDDNTNNNNINGDSIPFNGQNIVIPTGPLAKPWSHINADLLPANRKFDDIPLPPGWEWAKDPKSKKPYFFNREKGQTQWKRPEWPELPSGPKFVNNLPTIDNNVVNVDDETNKRRMRMELEKERENQRIRERESARALLLRQQEELDVLKRKNLESIIENATNYTFLGEKENNKKSFSSSNGLPAKSSKSSSSRSKKSKSRSEKETTDIDYLKLWKKLIASIVPNLIKKYETAVGHENLKNCARDIVHILADKELKRHGEVIPPKELDNEKKSKIKHFCRDYMTKFVEKYERKNDKKRGSNSLNTSTKKSKVN
ncbi:unnamed protein product [[Candida] boidinii]|uniref:Histone-lysine N-methyltransferase, H3 lysine-36 specific n=1 Tax=Candida boidinii TaxID=5477 RepID=A0A9W6SVQ9_CANBO|nr:hypothetical protein B5S30_g2353 [[Candida] boidinii]OWB83320.1 hypothetical protein B5S33_g1949 [[Candida] boidinii]GME68048.1 unnamed protein product [[Candida] boidinii]GMF97887.1 unnamed protein product [[Candida] boidinii]